MLKYRILTFDGGGIRGALTATLLKRLSDFFPSLIKKVDLFAGTSTGSFIALGLAHGLSPQKLIDLYLDNGKYIFTPKYPVFLRPKYSNKHLKEILSKIFTENLKLKHLQPRVMIPSFKVADTPYGIWQPIFFNNFPRSETENEFVVDVALSSSAAPIYFPSYNKHIDGGVIANNPSTAAISIAIDKGPKSLELDNIYLLSIGTGFNPIEIKGNTKKWGLLEWLINFNPKFPLESVLLDGAVEADTYFSSQLLKKQYFRLNPQLQTVVGLDDYEEIPHLISLGENFDLNPTTEWIEKYWL